jgi:hypothetical protein
MADDDSSLHIDLDWKKQAQEEKRRLAEEAASKPKSMPVPPSRPVAVDPATGNAKPAGAASGRAAAATRDRNAPASFVAMVQQFVTQVLFYLGEIDVRGSGGVNLDMAKYYIDTLGILEEKTANNLTEEERQVLDAALYESRMRYVNVASQYT